jgi:site-specific recombinase XerD
MAATGAFKASKAAALTFTPMMYMEEYLEQKTAEGKNVDYVRQVRNSLCHFADFMRSENVLHPEEITRLHIVRFQGYCKDRANWSDRYVVQIMKCVRAWILWMVELHYITVSPWVAIKVGQIKKEPKPLEDADLDLLFEAHRRSAFQIEPFPFHRREVILCLLYGWGLRIHELEALNVANMDMRLNFVTARNKGGGTKTLPYTDEIKRVVNRWMNHRVRHAERGEDALLITVNGTRLPKEQIRQIVTDLGKSCGVTLNPHRLRDTCGTNLLDDDVPVERVAAILGQTDIKMTLAYSRVNNKKVFESVENSMDPRLFNLFNNTRSLPRGEA